jgi:hypothetical protein
MRQIPHDEISFHPHSYGDPDGRLFSWKGELYRGISNEKTSFFRGLFEQGVLQKLMERGILIDSEPAELSLEGYGLVLHHRRIPFVSYPHEWCAVMFRNAGLAYLDLVDELARAGLVLKDTHPWNLLFDGFQPVYVDLTSLKPVTKTSQIISDEKFHRYYIYPLLLMSAGQERILRHLLPDYEGISQTDVLMLTQKNSRLPSTLKRNVVFALRKRVPKRWRGPLKGGLESSRNILRKLVHSQASPLGLVERLKGELAGIPLPVSANGKSNSSPQASGSETTEKKLKEIISKLRPPSILVIGRGLPDPAELTSLAGSKLVFLDRHSDHITRLYSHAVEKKLPLLPLVMDFTDPTPSRGLASHLSIAAEERLQCEMVIAMGLVKQVVAERHLRFDQIVHGTAQFSKRWLIIDFTPFDRCEQSSDVNRWYTRENFIAALRKKFMSVEFLSDPSEVHGLLLCEK